MLLLKSSWLTVLSLHFLRLPFLYGFFSLPLFSFRLMSGTCSSSVTSYKLLHNLLMSPYASTHICTYGGGGLVTKSCLTLLTPWTVAYQDPLSLGFPRQEYWMGCHFLFQGIFSTQGSNPHLLWVLYHWANWEALNHLGCFEIYRTFIEELSLERTLVGGKRAYDQGYRGALQGVS